MRALLLTLLLACGPKAAPPMAAATAQSTALVALHSSPTGGSPTALPESVQQALLATLTEHNLPATPLSAERFGPGLQGKRLSPHRLSWLAENADGAKLIVLIETEVERYSELSGRYRWVVHLRTSVAPADNPSAAISRQTDFPVFLEHHHEREAEALLAAAPLLRRELSRLLDDWIAGTQP